MVSTISIQSVNLGAQVAQRLREMILRRDLPDGMRLVEEELAGRFDVSRGPIRDALKQLEREGLVAVRKRAAYVVGLTAEDIGHLYDLRKALELLAVKAVVVHATDQQFAEMQGCVERMREAAVIDDHPGFADADVDFHGLLFTISGNRRLADVWHQYMPILATILQSAVGQEERLHKSAEDHNSLLGMLRAADDRVADEVSDHIDRARERMIAAYERLAIEAAG
ncbi:GntR family transcriptional regulator [Cryobacterium tepidiphilum]|nr:GntR family transcriptional regulator [Cryobacterium tepidiphilum]